MPPARPSTSCGGSHAESLALAIPLTSGDGDERFEFGLDLLIRGLEAHVEKA